MVISCYDAIVGLLVCSLDLIRVTLCDVGVAVHYFDATDIPDRLSRSGLPNWGHRH